jgi:hypothetical protein
MSSSALSPNSKLDGSVPYGWTYNPSTRSQRMPVIGIALCNAVVAAYLAVCQIGFHGQAWDPFFGDGTQRVLTSDISRAFPVSDAALGAVAYLLEAIFGFIGDEQRWRSKPWLVLTFGLLVLPLFFVSIALMILQPVVVHAWCSLCLLCAAGMLIMVPLALDEVIASVQFLQDAARQEMPLWHIFWHGGMPGDVKANEAYAGDARPGRTAAFTGYRPPWTLVMSAGVGIALLFMPTILGDVNEAAASLYVTGALVITCSCLAFAEVARPARYLLIGCGAWLLTISPFSMQGATEISNLLAMVAACILFACSYPRGAIREHYGNWSRFLA